MSAGKVSFPVGDLTLEGILHPVENARTTRVPGAVVCHPHPLYGGDMHNNVVVSLCEALSAHGVAALRFNFRGVGDSEGSHGGGHAERDDARAGLAFLASQPGIDAKRLCLAGYSFGAVVALSAGCSTLVGIAAVSPPLSGDLSKGFMLECPALFVFGEKDRVAPASALEQGGLDLPPGSRIAVISGADHFWWGYEGEVVREVIAFFKECTQRDDASTRDGAPR